ncbi:MAG: hypothetical protein ACK56F_05980, partial [bacterium]
MSTLIHGNLHIVVPWAEIGFGLGDMLAREALGIAVEAEERVVLVIGLALRLEVCEQRVAQTSLDLLSDHLAYGIGLRVVLDDRLLDDVLGLLIGLSADLRDE